MSIHYSLSIAILLSFLRLNFRVELSRKTSYIPPPPSPVLQLHVSLPISLSPLLQKLHFPFSRNNLSFSNPRVFYIPIDKIGYIKSSTVENYRYEIIDKNRRNEIISENVNCSVQVEKEKKKKRKRVSSDSTTTCYYELHYYVLH